MTEKSDSTVDVPGNTEASPPQTSFRVLNRPRSGFHPSSNKFPNTDCAAHLNSLLFCSALTIFSVTFLFFVLTMA